MLSINRAITIEEINALKTTYFDKIIITPEEANAKYFKSKWYKFYDSEQQYLDKNPKIAKVRDGIYKWNKQSDKIAELEACQHLLQQSFGELLNSFTELNETCRSNFEELFKKQSEIMSILSKL